MSYTYQFQEQAALTGNPYAAQILLEHDDMAEGAYAQVRITPPFTPTEEILGRQYFHDDSLTMEHWATTVGATVLEVNSGGAKSEDELGTVSYERGKQCIIAAVAGLLEELNNISNGEGHWAVFEKSKD